MARKNGKKLMPLPQLKKEMYEFANVHFHIYAYDRFLKFYNEHKTERNKIDDKTIAEVRKIREQDEQKIIRGIRIEPNTREFFIFQLSNVLLRLMNNLTALHLSTSERDKLDYYYDKIKFIHKNFFQANGKKMLLLETYTYTTIILKILYGTTFNQNTPVENTEIEKCINMINSLLNQYSHLVNSD